MRILPLIALAALVLTGPALAQQPTARVSGGDVNLRAGPGTNYAILGRLPANTAVELDYCTRSGNWCLVLDKGWVNASYLVGWSAKIRATPPSFLVDPFFQRDDTDDDDDRGGLFGF